MTIFTIRGIPVRLHSSFLLLAALLVGGRLLGSGPAAAASLALLGVGLFGSVLLHELGHALAARRLGIRTRSITLYPFGGVAALAGEPRSPGVELIVALAGPAVNFGLAALSLLPAALGLPGAGSFAALNLVMGLFNLAPAFPMDGGRVLRAWLSISRGRLAATEAALRVSRVLAWGFVVTGLLISPSLALVGLFLLWAGAAERRRCAVARAAAWRPAPIRRSLFEHPAC